jgi:hypothetical protein
MVEFMKATHASQTFAEFESVVHKQLGTAGWRFATHEAMPSSDVALNPAVYL